LAEKSVFCTKVERILQKGAEDENPPREACCKAAETSFFSVFYSHVQDQAKEKSLQIHSCRRITQVRLFLERVRFAMLSVTSYRFAH